MDLEDNILRKKAMVEEMDALKNNEAWDLVELSLGRKPIGSKWVFLDVILKLKALILVRFFSYYKFVFH